MLEGDAGFLKVFCTEWDLSDLTHGLGSEFATLNLCLKCFPALRRLLTSAAGTGSNRAANRARF